MQKHFIAIQNILILFLNFTIIFTLAAQNSNETRVSLSSFVEPREVPLNRTTHWTVQIKWQDALSLVEIENFEEPALSNFDIVGSSASNRRLADATGQTSIKEITYTLTPRTLGMGYIESAAISYKDKATGESHHLMTQRIGVEVIEPVPEPGEVQIPWLPILFAIVLAAVIAVSLVLRKRSITRKAAASIEDHSLLEENILKELKSGVDLSSPNRNDSLAMVTKLFRKYISVKYDIPALEATTSDLIQKLKESGIESHLVEKCEMMLSKADVIRFSGKEATPAELDEAYGTVETVLENNLKEIITAGEKSDNK
ncbi:hypothetical protein HQ585_15115 [candidate division KSB1 bacterium]|nr:hypothetical protein [candidate division KSB1 bacterium]